MSAATASELLTPRDAHNLRIFGFWISAMAISLIAGTFLIEARFVPLAWLLPATCAFLGLMAVRAYVIFIRNADELLRKIHLEALAVGFGAGLVFMPTYRLCERLGAPKLDSVDPIIVFVVACGLALSWGFRKYSTEEGR